MLCLLVFWLFFCNIESSIGVTDNCCFISDSWSSWGHWSEVKSKSEEYLVREGNLDQVWLWSGCDQNWDFKKCEKSEENWTWDFSSFFSCLSLAHRRCWRVRTRLTSTPLMSRTSLTWCRTSSQRKIPFWRWKRTIGIITNCHQHCNQHYHVRTQYILYIFDIMIYQQELFLQKKIVAPSSSKTPFSSL